MRKYMLAFFVKWLIYLFCGCLCTRLLCRMGKRIVKRGGSIGSEGKRGTVTASRPSAFSRHSHHYGPGSCCWRKLEQIFPQDKEVRWFLGRGAEKRAYNFTIYHMSWGFFHLHGKPYNRV